MQGTTKGTRSVVPHSIHHHLVSIRVRENITNSNDYTHKKKTKELKYLWKNVYVHS